MQYLLSFIALSASANAYADIGRFVEAQRLARSLENRGAVVPFPPIGGVPRANGSVPFDAATQLVSVSGNHAVCSILPKRFNVRISRLSCLVDCPGPH